MLIGEPLTSSVLASKSFSSCHAPQWNGFKCTLRMSHFFASSSFRPFMRITPYRYSSHPWLRSLKPFSLRSASQPSSPRARSGNSRLAVIPPSDGPRTISVSSSFRFSPERYLAYSARNNDFWLSLGYGLFLAVSPNADALAFPFCGVNGCFDLVFVDVVERGTGGIVGGRKTAAQRSYSRVSK